MKTKILLLSFLALSSPAQAITYNLPLPPIGSTTTFSIVGDLPNLLTVQFNLPVINFPNPATCPTDSTCLFGFGGQVYISDALPTFGLLARFLQGTFNGTTCAPMGFQCFNTYFPGFFEIDNANRNLTISHSLSLLNTYPGSMPDPFFISFDLPDGLTLSEAPAFAALDLNETPLPAALPLFATGLGALGLLVWRRKRKSNDAG